MKLLIIIRHGERTDRVGEIPKCGNMNPELTEKGKKQSFLAGKLTLDTIMKYGIKEISPNLIEIRTSPYMRTIQTSIQILKSFNTNNKNNNNENLNLNKIYIDHDLRKRIKPEKKFDQKDFLYKTVETYLNFDKDLENFEFLGDKGNFDLNSETKEDCKKRSIKYTNTILKQSEKKICIIVGHRGPLKYILEKLGYKVDKKMKMDYCSQFFFDVKNGIDNAKFLEVINKPDI